MHSVLRIPNILIAVVGPRGAGKTFFIELCAGNPKPITLEAEGEPPIHIYTVIIGSYHGQVMLIDIPGIDSMATSTMYPRLLHEWLEKYSPAHKISGIMYFHRIDSLSFNPSLAKNTLRAFRPLCDNQIVKRGAFAFVTNFWGFPYPENDYRLEHRFLGTNGAWIQLFNKGAQYFRFCCYDPVTDRSYAEGKANEILLEIVDRTKLEKPLDFIEKGEEKERDVVDQKIRIHNVEDDQERATTRCRSSGQFSFDETKGLVGQREAREALEEKYRKVLDQLVQLKGRSLSAPEPPQSVNHNSVSPPSFPRPPIRYRSSVLNPEITDEAEIYPSPMLLAPVSASPFQLWMVVAKGQQWKIERTLGTPFLQIDQKTECGSTALMKAVYDNKINIAALLLKEGAKPTSAKDRNGVSALHLAAYRGNRSMAKLLLKYARGDVDPRTNSDSTPLHVACLYEKSEVVKILLKNGADATLRNGMGRTPLYYAVMKKNAKIAGMLNKTRA